MNSMEKPLNLPDSAGDMIENYLPDYSKRNDVFRLDILRRYLDCELDEEQMAEYGLVDDELGNHQQEYIELSEALYKEAMISFLCVVCELQRQKCVENYYSNLHTQSPQDLILLAPMPLIKTTSHE